jgi:hypothetical protein
MRKTVYLILVSAFIVAGCGSTTSTATSAPGTGTDAPSVSQAAGQSIAIAGDGCSTGTYKTFKTTTYCGPAKATITIAGTAYQLSGGKCLYDPSVGFAVTIGTTVTGTADIAADGPQSLFVSSLPGAGGGAMVAGFVHGASFTITDGDGADTVTIAADHKSGTATGAVISTDDVVTVTFSC